MMPKSFSVPIHFEILAKLWFFLSLRCNHVKERAISSDRLLKVDDDVELVYSRFFFKRSVFLQLDIVLNK